MTTSALEFPCIEATRCLVTEKEMGMRLTVKTLVNNSENSYIATFTKEKSPQEEWYLHLDLAENEENGGNLQRVLQLRHSETGQYLSCDEKGRVNCISTPSPSTCWWMERVDQNKALATGENGVSTPSKSLSNPTNSPSDESTEDQYILISKKYPLRRLTYSENLKGFNGSNEEYQLIASKKKSAESSIWTLKFTSGELCYISNPVVHHQMRCNLLGQLSLTSKMDGWEVFRFIEAGNGDLYISSWTHYNKFLSSDSDGQIYTTDNTSTSLGHNERWRLEDPPTANGVFIRNVASRRYLSVGRKRSEHLWTTTKPNDYALWHLDAPNSHLYYLTSIFASADKKSGVGSSENPTNDFSQTYSKGVMEDFHISSSKKGPFLAQKKQDEEEWKVELTPEGYFTFFSNTHEKYLGCNSTGDVHTTTSKGAWTLWEKQDSPHGGVAFLSKEHLRFLAVSETDNSLCTTEGEKEVTLCNSWRLDPRLPRTISGGTGGYIAGAMGLTIAVASPFAVLGAIEAAATLSLNDSNVKSIGLSKDADGSNENKLEAQRPVSAWKSWIKSDPKTASILNSSSESPTSVKSPVNE